MAVFAILAACTGVSPSQSPAGISSPAPMTISPTPSASQIGAPSVEPTPGSPEATPSASASETPAGPDLVLFGGNVITVDPTFTIASAVAIDDGRIVAVGGDEVRALASADSRLVNLDGRTVLPGIVDPHTHELQHAAHSGIDALVGVEEHLLSHGRTTIGNPGIERDALERLREFGATGRSRIRLHMYLAYNDYCDNEFDHWYRDIEFSRDSALRQAVAGIKVFLDGGACDAPAVTFDWDTDRWQGQGDLFVDPEEVAEVIATADSLGAQVVMHSAGDRALDAGLDGLELELAGRQNVNRHRIDHLMFVRPDQLARLGPMGVLPVLFGTHQSCLDTEESSVVRFLPDEQVRWLEPRRQVIDANPQVPAGWHSDTPLLPVSPFENLAGLTGLGESLGRPGSCESDILRENQVTTREGITMMTISSAYAMQLETEVGSIEVGKAADLIVIARDPLPLVGVEHLDNSLLATMIDGRFEYCAPAGADLCAGGEPPTGPARASVSLPGAGPEKVLDGDLEAGWMAGAEPPQWIELDLGAERHVTRLRLHVDQHPAGFTRHVVYGGTSARLLERLVLLEGDTTHGQVLEVALDDNLRHIRIETVASPSWVGWLEIEVVSDP